MSTALNVGKTISELTALTNYSEDYNLVIHDGTSLKKVTAANFRDFMAASGSGSHNAIYRGKNLGTTVTTAQYSAISAGTFTDLFIGDYWVINGVNWRIAAFDYWYNKGDTACSTHHVVVVPDSSLGSA